MAIFTGTAGNDVLKGTTDADTLHGLAGNDSYTVDHTDDVIVEAPGEGIDRITSSVTYDLSDEVEILVLTGTASLDSHGNDLDNSLTGNSGSNHLYTGNGIDTVIAGLGDDTVEAGVDLTAADRLDGGAGVDRLRLDGDYAGGVTLSAANVVNFESIALADGNSYALTLNDATNSSTLLVKGSRLTTGTLNLDGSAETKSALTAFGGSGDDTLIGGGGADVLRGGGGADVIAGGAGGDTASYGTSADGVSVDLTDNGNNAGGDAAGDILTGIENLAGSDFNDTLVGDNGANVLDGGNGDDSLVAGAGNDKLLGGAGFDNLVVGGNLTAADTIDGGDDYDSLEIDGNFAAGFAFGKNITNIEEIDVLAGNSYKFTLTALTNTSSLFIDGTALGAGDSLKVNGAAETINSLTFLGGQGDDSVVAGAAADFLSGGAGGNDTITAGVGDDTIDQGENLNSLDRIDGGAGKDTLRLSGDYSGGVVFSATTVTNVEAVQLDGGFDYTLILNNSTNKTSLIIDGQTLGAGVISIDGSAETSNALTLLGNDSDDLLRAGGGADSLVGGFGADTLAGGGGVDITSYEFSADGVVVNLTSNINTGGDAEGDSITGVEHVIGTILSDSIIGDTAANSMVGGAGDDTLGGGAGGNDTLIGEAGDDTFVMGGSLTAADSLVGGDGFDTIILDGNYSAGVTLGAAATKIESIVLTTGNNYKLALNDATAGLTLIVDGSVLGAGNTLQFNGAAEKTSSMTVLAGAGNDILTGGAGDNLLDGGAGNDKLTAGIGANTLTGGSGLDTLLGGAGDDVLTGGNDNDSISGGAGINQMLGGAGADTIVGGAKDDTLDGGTENDNLSGGAGANLFVGGAGTDTISGGAGIDTASYATSAGAVTINLGSAAPQVGGDAAGDRLTGIENVTGSALNDSITGSTVGNLLQGLAGTDTLLGLAGNDTLEGGAQADVLDGGAGIDQASYAGAGSAVLIDLNKAVQAGGDAQGDSYTGIEGALGSNFNDTLIGNTAANSISGGGGDDQIVMGANFTAADSLDGGAGDLDTLLLDGNYAGGVAFAATTLKNIEVISLTAGNSYKLTLADASISDILTVDGSALGANTLYLTASAEKSSSLTAIGAAGNDTLTGGGGKDIFIGGAGADRLTGGANSDTSDYSQSLAGVSIDLNSTKAQISAGDANGDILSGIENLVGTDFADKLIGNASANALTGGDQDDTLTGGGSGDTIDGGLGTDVADYSGSKAGVTIDFGSGAGKGGDAAGDVLSSIEIVIGSKGNDRFVESADIHEIHGGLGTDLVDYSGSDAEIEIDLTLAGPQSKGFAEGDILTGIESIVGTKSSDKITGNGASNRLEGGGSFDTLTAGAGGDDTLLGGDGSDVINVGGSLTAKDQIDGGQPDDDPDIEGVDGDILNIAGDYSAGVTLGAATVRNVEIFEFEDGFDYSFRANNATNSKILLVDASELGAASNLRFDAAAETSNAYIFMSGAGADTLIGGKGVDQLDFSKATADVFADLADSANNGGFAAGDVYTAIENIRGSDFNDQLTGDKRNNLLEGGVGDDTLSGGAGNDTLSGGQGKVVGDDGADFFDGGVGIDVITFEESLSSVVADLSNFLNGGAAGGDLYAGIEILIGTKFDDELYGDDANNRIEGGNGFDFLSGGLGNDTLIGGDDADIFSESELSVGDRIDGGDDVDDLDTEFAFEGDTLQLGGDFSKQFSFGSMTVRDVEKFELFGGGLNYVLKLHDATNSSTLVVDASSLFDFDIFKLDGSAETKNALTVWGGAGNDTITGGGGADILAGGFGADLLTGGKNIDTANYEKSFEGVTVDLSLKTAQVSTGEASGDVLVLIENLTGSEFDDLLTGDKNGNVLEGGKGNDTLNGGLGTDVASYQHVTDAVFIDLLDPTKNTGGAAGDVFTSIEGAIGTKEDDTIQGNGSANYIDGGKGKDTLTSGHGKDTVIGGDGNDRIEVGFSLDAFDRINGGEDQDTVILDGNYSTTVVLGAATLVDVERLELTAGNNYRLTLADGNNSSKLEIDGSALQEDEVLAINGAAEKNSDLIVFGGADNDTVVGGGGSDKFTGAAGNDLFVGNAGNDDLDGGDGNDKIDGGLGDDTIAGGFGIDRVTGGAGLDSFLMAGNLTASDRIDGGLGEDTLTLDGDYKNGLVFGALTLLNVETIVLTTGNSYSLTLDTATNGKTLTIDASSLVGGNDLFLDAHVENKDSFIVKSGAGNDTIFTGGGADTIEGGAGADQINGGAGIDTISYENASAGVSVDLLDSSNNTDGDAAGDVLLNFENIVGSKFDDALTGNKLNNVIAGGDGRDTIDGGLGIDTLDFSLSEFTVGLDLGAGFGFGGDAFGDKYTNIENVIGTDVVSDDPDFLVGDDISGNAAANLLDGRLGDDILIGAGGNDTLLAGAGRDNLEGGTGADILDGGSGEDWIYYNNSTAAVTVDLKLKGAQISTGEANGDVISGVENIHGSNFRDLLKGDLGQNDFEGGKGADTMDGGGGGADAVNYFDSDKAVQVSLAVAGPQMSTGDANGDVLININNLRGSEFDDRLTGNGVRNGFFGWYGSDTITGGGGDDMIEYNRENEGVDLITDFKLGEGGDFMQIVDVLEDYDGSISVDNYARIQMVGLQAQFQVNADGKGNDWETLAILQGIKISVAGSQMLEDGNLQVTGEF